VQLSHAESLKRNATFPRNAAFIGICGRLTYSKRINLINDVNGLPATRGFIRLPGQYEEYGTEKGVYAQDYPDGL